MRPFLFAAFILSTFAACTNENDDFLPAYQVADLLPLQVGKYITYRLDSTVFVKSGTQTELHAYQVRHTVQATTMDNLDRQTFLIQRTIRDKDGNEAWKDNGTYYITPTPNSFEFIDNNLRSINLSNPVRLNATWKGNSYMPAAPYQQLYNMEVGQDMNTWEFKFTNFGNETIQNQSYTDVWTIEQVNNIQNIPPTTPGSYGSKEVVVEKYAKNIGLVYRNFELYEHQPPNADNPQETYIGFGITMWMIDHN